MLNRVSFTIFAVSLSQVAFAEGPRERMLYVGKDSTEAVMTFSHQVELESEATPTSEEAKEQIDQQLDHLFGPLSEARFKAVPRGNHKITGVKVHAKKNAPGVYVASYSYKGTIVLQNGVTANYPIILPINPDTIYQDGIVTRAGKETYPCTDSHYTSEGDFWYFWNPEKPGCPLKEGVHFEEVQAKVERIKNTKLTYPEYDRLIQKDGTIRISVLMGMDDAENGKDPLTSGDTNAENYRAMRDSLISMGFKVRKLEAAELKKISPKVRGIWVEEFTKQTKKAPLVVRLSFGPSGIDEKSRPFHYLFKDAVENASIMIYDGHSGLGGHLDLGMIEDEEGFKFKPNKDQYQIYFFNSCTSYTYYNTMYFGRKKTSADPNGTKNLDILTNGLATYFYVMNDTNLALIRAVHAWSENKGSVSYQKLANEIDSDNLFGINGDEDNPSSSH